MSGYQTDKQIGIRKVNSPPVKTLLIEDDTLVADLFVHMLSRAESATFDVQHAVSLSDGVGRLHTAPVDLILMDLHLPDSSGTATFDRVHALYPDTAIVILTGTDDEQLAETLLYEGARDYLHKGSITDQKLVVSIHAALARHKLLNELERQSSLLTEMVQDGPVNHHDSLDGIGQALFSVRLITASLPRLRKRNNADLEWGLDELQLIIEDTLTKINIMLTDTGKPTQ